MMNVPPAEVPPLPSFQGVEGLQRRRIGFQAEWQFFCFESGGARQYSMVGTNSNQGLFKLEELQGYCLNHGLLMPLEAVRYGGDGGLGLLYPPLETLHEVYSRHGTGQVFNQMMKDIFDKLFHLQQVSKEVMINAFTIAVVDGRGVLVSPTYQDNHVHQVYTGFWNLRVCLLNLMGRGNSSQISNAHWRKMIRDYMNQAAYSTLLCRRLRFFHLFLYKTDDKNGFIDRVYKGQHYNAKFKTELQKINVSGWVTILSTSQIGEVRAVLKAGGYSQNSHNDVISLIKFLRNFKQHWLERHEEIVKMDGELQTFLQSYPGRQMNMAYLVHHMQAQDHWDVANQLGIDGRMIFQILAIVNSGIRPWDPADVEPALFREIESRHVRADFFEKLFASVFTCGELNRIKGFDDW